MDAGELEGRQADATDPFRLRGGEGVWPLTTLLLLLIRTSSSCRLGLEEGAGLSGREEMRAFCCEHVSLRNGRG